MKKLLIATAALAMVAGTAQAQSSVTVYGIIDVGYGSSETEQGQVAASNKLTGLADSTNASSRIGFRGTEDLGGGLSAGFVLESGLNITGGATINKTNGTTVTAATNATNSVSADSAVFGAATRQAFVTLGGAKTGTVLVGYKKQLESDFNDTFMIGTENSFGAEGQELNRLGRANQIAYTLPAFGGLSASVAYTNAVQTYDLAATDAASKFDAEILSANLLYKAGQLTIGGHIGSGEATLGTVHTSGSTGVALASVGAFAPGVNKYDTQAVGASYDFGFIKVSAMYGERETGVNQSTRIDSDYTNLGIAYPMGKTTLKASLSNSQSKDASGNTVTDDKGYQLQADYSLSKRTTAWAIYGVNKREAVVAASAVTGVSAAVSAANAIDYTTMRVGVTHSF
jgi:predicted porin